MRIMIVIMMMFIRAIINCPAVSEVQKYRPNTKTNGKKKKKKEDDGMVF